jgi:hypothetical protein
VNKPDEQEETYTKKERIKEVVRKSTSEGYKPKSKEEKIELKGD